MKLFSLLFFAASAIAQVTLGTVAPFGLVAVGSTGTETAIVTNGTGSALTLTAAVTGPFTVSPASFTVAANSTQTLTVTFSPSSGAPAFQSGVLTLSNSGTVLGASNLAGQANPFGAAAARLVCVIGPDGKTILAVAGVNQCFTVPEVVDESYQAFYLTQMNGDNYAYQGFWDYVTKFFTTDVIAKLNRFPPAAVIAAQQAAAEAAAQAAAAQAAVQAAALSVIQGTN